MTRSIVLDRRRGLSSTWMIKCCVLLLGIYHRDPRLLMLAAAAGWKAPNNCNPQSLQSLSIRKDECTFNIIFRICGRRSQFSLYTTYTTQ